MGYGTYVSVHECSMDILVTVPSMNTRTLGMVHRHYTDVLVTGIVGHRVWYMYVSTDVPQTS